MFERSVQHLEMVGSKDFDGYIQSDCQEFSSSHGLDERTPLTVRLRQSMSRVALSKAPQPTPDAKGAGVPERKIGSEALAASAKLRKSSIECLSAASFEAARRE